MATERPASAGPPSLLEQLPQEVLEEILNLLCIRDLASLIRASKRLKGKTDAVFYHRGAECELDRLCEGSLVPPKPFPCLQDLFKNGCVVICDAQPRKFTLHERDSLSIQKYLSEMTVVSTKTSAIMHAYVAAELSHRDIIARVAARCRKQCSDGFTTSTWAAALKAAVAVGDEDVLNLVLPWARSAIDTDFETVLMYAADQGTLSAVQKIVRMGGGLVLRNKARETPLIRAISRRRPIPIIAQLLPRSETVDTDAELSEALACALAEKNRECINFLLPKLTQPVAKRMYKSNSVFYHLGQLGDQDVINSMLSKTGEREHYIATLYTAVQASHLCVMQEMVEAARPPLTGAERQEILQHAMLVKSFGIAKSLVYKIFDEFKKSREIKALIKDAIASGSKVFRV